MGGWLDETALDVKTYKKAKKTRVKFLLIKLLLKNLLKTRKMLITFDNKNLINIAAFLLSKNDEFNLQDKTITNDKNNKFNVFI